MSIHKELDGEIDKLLKKARTAVHESTESALRVLASGSPVYSGWYVRNHRIAVNNPVFQVEPPDKPDNVEIGSLALQPSEIVAREKTTILSWNFGDTLFIGNNVPYAQEIEDGTKTKPQGNFFGQAAAVFRSTLLRKAKAL